MCRGAVNMLSESFVFSAPRRFLYVGLLIRCGRWSVWLQEPRVPQNHTGLGDQDLSVGMHVFLADISAHNFCYYVAEMHLFFSVKSIGEFFGPLQDVTSTYRYIYDATIRHLVIRI